MPPIPFLNLPPPAPPRLWLFVQIRNGRVRQLRAISEEMPTFTRSCRWIPMKISASGASLEHARRRLLAKWASYDRETQANLIASRMLDAYDRGLIDHATTMGLGEEGWANRLVLQPIG